MRLFSAVGFAALLFTTQGAFAALPFHVQTTSSASGNDLPKEGFTRLRLSLSSNESKADNAVHLGQVAVCSESACYQAETPSNVDLSNTTEGKSTFIADVIIPLIEVRSVHFGTITGEKSVLGDLTLDTPLKLEADYRGAEIAVVLKRNTEAGRSIYSPLSSATNIWHPEGTRVYYNPKFPTVAELPLGARLQVPAEATALPQIFHVSVHKAGGIFPMIDVFPNVKLSKAATITMARIERQQTDSNERLETLELDDPEKAAPASDPIKNLKTRTFKVFETGMIDGNSTKAPTPTGQRHTESVAASRWKTCEEAIIANRQKISQTIDEKGAIYLPYCKDIPPYVHIVVAYVPKIQFTLAHAREVWKHNTLYLPLHRLTTWSQNSLATLNGFTWEGDKGITVDGFGLALGYVANQYVVLGDNRVGGGAASKFSPPRDDPNTPSGGLKYTLFGGLRLQYQTSTAGDAVGNPTAPDGRQYPTYVSSSTVVSRAGPCPEHTQYDRWSAVGYEHQKLVFMSTATGRKTNGVSMCPIFKHLGGRTAFRMDGGTAAAITVNGELLNPLDGAAALVFGPSRHIAYGLKLTFARD